MPGKFDRFVIRIVVAVYVIKNNPKKKVRLLHIIIIIIISTLQPKKAIIHTGECNKSIKRIRGISDII